MTAPLVESFDVNDIEITVFIGEGDPMSAHGVVTDHFGLAVTVNVSVLGVCASMCAKA